jgi:hypothetical protein
MKITDARQARSTDMSGRYIDTEQDAQVDEVLRKYPQLMSCYTRVEIYHDLIVPDSRRHTAAMAALGHASRDT